MADGHTLVVGEREIATDEEGFLLDPDDWDPAVAEAQASALNIQMSEAHWEVVNFVREYFQQHQTVPEMRAALKFLQQQHGAERATRKYLYQLFPYGYGQQACKIAGMRKPRKLMLDV